MKRLFRFDGALLKEMRTGRGWNQRQLGKFSGVSYPFISQLETGSQQNPTVDSLARLAAAFNVRADVFIRRGR